MTPEQGCELAKYETPGYYVGMGPLKATMQRMQPLDGPQQQQTWLGRDLGFEPSIWAVMAALVAQSHGHKMTAKDWQWLCKKSTGLETARKWFRELAVAKVQR